MITRTMRERGSKLYLKSRVVVALRRSPCGSADRNNGVFCGFNARAVSLPMRERGSKQPRREQQVMPDVSLPMRERGSKQLRSVRLLYVRCRSPCGSADRNLDVLNQRRKGCGRSPCGSADRNSRTRSTGFQSRCRSPCGSVDRNSFCRTWVQMWERILSLSKMLF